MQNLKTLTSNGFTKAGYDFTGWSNGLTTKTIMFLLTEDVTISPQYEAIEYTITYNLDGGSATNPATYTMNTANITLKSLSID